jgi:hypothetical protein
MKKKTNQGKTINKEAFKMLALEIGLNAACRKLGVPINTAKSWARRGGWKLPKRPGGRPQRSLEATSLHPVADALVASHKELEGATKTGLMITAAKAATKAAQNPPLNVSSTSQFRDLATSSSRIFGWDRKGSPHTQYNQLVISAEKLEELRQLCDSDEEREETGRRLSEMTPEEMEEFRKRAGEWLGNEPGMEHQTLPLPAPSGPVTYEVKIKGDGTGVEITGDEGALS